MAITKSGNAAGSGRSLTDPVTPVGPWPGAAMTESINGIVDNEPSNPRLLATINDPPPGTLELKKVKRGPKPDASKLPVPPSDDVHVVAGDPLTSSVMLKSGDALVMPRLVS